jgi:hypothetical protein
MKGAFGVRTRRRWGPWSKGAGTTSAMILKVWSLLMVLLLLAVGLKSGAEYKEVIRSDRHARVACGGEARIDALSSTSFPLIFG